MSNLVSFAPGWNMDVPAGTMLVRADVVLNQRPGPGGFAAIIEASDLVETIIIRGGTPDTTTEDMIHALIAKLAAEIGANRAVVIVRSPPIEKAMAAIFKPYRMIRILGNSPLAVADASRHASIMAERAKLTDNDHYDRLLEARYERSEDFSENQDSGIVHTAIQELLKAVAHSNVTKPEVKTAAQHVLDAAEQHRTAKLQNAIRGASANDIPKRTKERPE